MNEKNELSTEIYSNIDISSETNSNFSSPQIEFPEYTEYNPLPVFVIDEIIPPITTYATNNVYYGTISDTYLDYFEGYLEKLSYKTDYLIWRSGAYSYDLAYGTELDINGNIITGNCNHVQIYRENNDYNSIWYVSNTTDNISVDTTGLFAYSSLGNLPTVERGLGLIESNTLLFAVGVLFVYNICHDIFDYILEKLGR